MPNEVEYRMKMGSICVSCKQRDLDRPSTDVPNNLNDEECCASSLSGPYLGLLSSVPLAHQHVPRDQDHAIAVSINQHDPRNFIFIPRDRDQHEVKQIFALEKPEEEEIRFHTTTPTPHVHSDSAQGTFDHCGGELFVRSYGFTLSIPREALEEGTSHEIGLQVLKKLPKDLVLGPDEMVVSFGFYCSPPGLQFKKRVKVSLPHCAVVPKLSQVKLILYTKSSDPGDDQRSSSWVRTEGSSCTIKDETITIETLHFSSFWGIIERVWVKAKKVSFIPLLPREMPGHRKPILHVQFFDTLHGSLEDMERDEKRIDYKPVSAKGTIDITSSPGNDLSITCTEVGEVKNNEAKVLPYRDLMRLLNHFETFIIDLTKSQDDILMSLHLKQDSERNLHFSTGYKGVPSLKGASPPLRTTPPEEGPQRVSENDLDWLSREVPHGKYHQLCRLLKVEGGYHGADNILQKHLNNSSRATRDVLASWKTATGGRVVDLCRALEESEMGGLAQVLRERQTCEPK